jgi:hypothetical protein
LRTVDLGTDPEILDTVESFIETEMNLNKKIDVNDVYSDQE